MERTCTGRLLVNMYYLRMVIRRCRANLSVAAFSEAFTFIAPERPPNDAYPAVRRFRTTALEVDALGCD